MSWAVNPRHQHDTAARCCAMLRAWSCPSRARIHLWGAVPRTWQVGSSWATRNFQKQYLDIYGCHINTLIYLYIYVIFYNSINICACLILFDDISWSQNSQLESNGISYNDLPSWGRKALCRNASLGSRWPHLSFLHFFQFLLLRLGE